MINITTEALEFVKDSYKKKFGNLDTFDENLTAYLSQNKDIDYTEAVTQWLNAQYAYQASMQIASASMNMSLLNYMQ